MVLFLIALNVLAFAIEATSPASLIDRLALWPLHPANTDAPAFHVWQLLTYSALHANLAHLGFNMLGLFMFGSEVERVLGARRTLKLYVASVACGAVAQLLTGLGLAGNAGPAIGASAGVFGVLVAYALIFPRRRVVLLFRPFRCPPGSLPPVTRCSNCCWACRAKRRASRISRTSAVWPVPSH